MMKQKLLERGMIFKSHFSRYLYGHDVLETHRHIFSEYMYKFSTENCKVVLRYNRPVILCHTI